MNVATVCMRWFAFRASMCLLITMTFHCRSKWHLCQMQDYRFISLTMKTCLKENTFLPMKMINGMRTMIFAQFSFVKEPWKPLKNLDGLRILFIAVAGGTG